MSIFLFFEELRHLLKTAVAEKREKTGTEKTSIKKARCRKFFHPASGFKLLTNYKNNI
jgi:hypothetical protein